ncbi:PH domain-containing protein [Saccharopolyspora griseoalba]|uniref:PH domain-containing protein n=1 Tax=Saccharopolyspora griseoalba TaxID=1431848 RepID=A0ABW2LR07_9PSEU
MSGVFDGGWHQLELRSTLAVLIFVLLPLPVTLLIMLIAGAGAIPVLSTTGIWLAVAALIGAAGFYEWHFARYRITAERFEFSRGGVFRSHRSIPRERIRAVDLTANPVQRVLRIATVKVSTGGQGGEGEIRLDAIDRAAAEEIRRGLILRERAEAEPADGLLAELNPLWLAYSALTVSLMLVVWGAIGSVVGNAQEVLASWGVWRELGDAFLALGLVLFALLSVAAALLVGVVGAVLLSAEMWWGYRLTREPGGTLRVTRGLLTTRSLSLEERRLRGVELSEPLLLRWFRGARLNAVATGLNSTQGSDQKKQPERKTLLPPAPRTEALRVTWKVLRHSAFDVALRGHTRRALRRRINWALFAAVPVLLACSALAWLGRIPVWLVVLVAVLALAIGLGFAVDAHRNLGHGLDDRYLLARNGSGLRRTVALQRDDIIGWRISRTVFQRRAGLMTVGATTAAGSHIYRVHDVDTGTGLAVADEAVPGLIAPFLQRD